MRLLTAFNKLSTQWFFSCGSISITMSSTQNKQIEPSQPCTWQSDSSCQNCQIKGRLQCRFESKNITNFFMVVMPYAVTVIAGAIHAGYGRYLLLWLAYSFFFFFVWEARILCRHCPYWAENARILHCHANYGVFKIWKYEPDPMSKSERAQFILSASIWLILPFPLLLISAQYLLTLIGACTAISGVFLLKRNICSKCLNFSCPLNTVPKNLVDSYLELNPRIKEAWEHSSYQRNAR